MTARSNHSLRILKQRIIPLLAFLALLWLQLFFALVPTWSGGTYYDYGWLVGPFALIFFWRRWEECGVQWAPRPTTWFWIAIVPAVLLLIPLRTIQHIDVYWRLPLWIHAAVVFGVTHALLGIYFGWATSKSLLPATLFALLALPLPSFLEHWLVFSLTDQVINISTATLPYLGYPVDVSGNTLIVKDEFLDVTEGCSGIRSFQSSAMAGICLGELLRLSVTKRFALVVLGLLLALVFNSTRIVILARIAYDHGQEASDAAHDPVGFWMLILTYGGISLCAWWLTRANKRKRSVARKVVSANA